MGPKWGIMAHMPGQLCKKNEIPEGTRSRILEALTLHISRGLSLSGALEQAGVSRSWFYELRETHPEEIAELTSEARRRAKRARKERRDQVLAAQEDRALGLSGVIMQGIEDSVGNLIRIAKGEHEEIELPNGQTKVLMVYPRDSVGAVTQLQALLVEGLLPEGVLIQNEEDDHAPPPPAFPGFDFSRVEATAPDGTKVTVERGEELEGEYEEV